MPNFGIRTSRVYEEKTSRMCQLFGGTVALQKVWLINGLSEFGVQKLPIKYFIPFKDEK